MMSVENITSKTKIDSVVFKVLELGVKNASVVVSSETKFDSESLSKIKVNKQLVFNNIGIADINNGINPTFLCPDCKRPWTPKLDFGTVDLNNFDFNDQITVTIPEHTDSKGQKCACSGGVISLFYAVHVEKGVMQVCIQRADAEGAGGIKADWYKPKETL